MDSSGTRQPAAYRYTLRREFEEYLFGPARPMLWVAFNPSTAEGGPGGRNDPSVRRMIGFSRREGAAGMTLCNVYGARSSDPTELESFADPIGPDNDDAIRAELARAHSVVVAWGDLANRTPARRQRAADVAALILESGVPAFALGFTASGQPKHPLYAADTPLQDAGPALRRLVDTGGRK